MLTVTNDGLRKSNEPSKEYSDTIKMGIKENWSEMSEEDINNYINSCIKN